MLIEISSIELFTFVGVYSILIGCLMTLERAFCRFRLSQPWFFSSFRCYRYWRKAMLKPRTWALVAGSLAVVVSLMFRRVLPAGSTVYKFGERYWWALLLIGLLLAGIGIWRIIDSLSSIKAPTDLRLADAQHGDLLLVYQLKEKTRFGKPTYDVFRVMKLDNTTPDDRVQCVVLKPDRKGTENKFLSGRSFCRREGNFTRITVDNIDFIIQHLHEPILTLLLGRSVE